MRLTTLVALAEKHGVRLPDALTKSWPPTLSAADERGWFRFQRLYDMARSCVRDEADMRRIVREAAQDDAAEGSRWLEIQVDPTSYAPFWKSSSTRRARPPRMSASVSPSLSPQTGSGTHWMHGRWLGWPRDTPVTVRDMWSGSG